MDAHETSAMSSLQPSTPPVDAAERMRMLDRLARTATKATRQVEVLETRAEESELMMDQVNSRLDKTDATLEQLKEMMMWMVKRNPDCKTPDTNDDKTTDFKTPDANDDKTPDFKPDANTDDKVIDTKDHKNPSYMKPVFIDPPKLDDMPLTRTTLLNESENANPLKLADPDQHVDTSIRHTTDFGTLFRHFKSNDAEEAFAAFDKDKLLSGDALRAAGAKFQDALKHFDDPKLITKALMGIRLVSMSGNLPWQQTASEVIQSYVQTAHEDVQAFADHCKIRGTPPGSKRISSITGTPGS